MSGLRILTLLFWKRVIRIEKKTYNSVVKGRKETVIALLQIVYITSINKLIYTSSDLNVVENVHVEMYSREHYALRLKTKHFFLNFLFLCFLVTRL